MSGSIPIVVLGAGPAGLGAALQLARRGHFDVRVLERNEAVGGNAGSFPIGDLQVDYGSHRLHPSCPAEILADIRSMLGEDLLDRPRHGRIRIRNQWVHFPLKPLDLAVNLPLAFSAGVLGDSLMKRFRNGQSDTFASVLEHGLGRTICRDFYFPYAFKIWGVAPSQLDAEQARRRVSAGSLGKLVRKALGAVPGLKRGGAGRFYYPRKGFGQISSAYACAGAEHGVSLLLQANVAAIQARGRDSTVSAVIGGRQEEFSAHHVLSTIPVPQLVRLVQPAAPGRVHEAASTLQYRAMLLVYLVLEAERFTEFDAHYFPGAEIPITRLSEPKNYGLAVSARRTVLCAELPCSKQDEAWRATDSELQDLVLKGLAAADLPVRLPVERVVVKRLPQAYPIYLRGYRESFDAIDQWLAGTDGLVTLGRQGLFAHDNTHHTLAMAYAAAACIDDDGQFNRERWQAHRREFESHVVED